MSIRSRVPGAGKARDPIRIVRHEHQRRVVAAAAIRSRELEIDRVGVGAQQVGKHAGPGLELGVAVGLRLDDLGIDAKRGVVDEDAVVDAGEIDAPLNTVRERIQRTHDVITVEAEVEGEVVSSPRRNADEGDIAPRGNGRNERLRAIAAGHPDDPRTTRDGGLGELEQVIAGLQDDRLDAPLPSMGSEIKALGLATTGLQVDDQHRRSVRRPPARAPRPRR